MTAKLCFTEEREREREREREKGPRKKTSDQKNKERKFSDVET